MFINFSSQICALRKSCWLFYNCLFHKLRKKRFENKKLFQNSNRKGGGGDAWMLTSADASEILSLKKTYAVLQHSIKLWFWDFQKLFFNVIYIHLIFFLIFKKDVQSFMGKNVGFITLCLATCGELWTVTASFWLFFILFWRCLGFFWI